MKTLLPWILVAGLGASLGAVFISGQSKDAELTKLREQSQQAQAEHTELEEARNAAKVLTDQIAGLQKDREELMRLRNEVGQLRAESQKLSNQAQSAQLEAERARTQITQAAQANAQQLQAMQARNQEIAMRFAQTQTDQALSQSVNACINNLRQLDGAKQQWALEHNKTGSAVPTPQDVAVYLKDNTLPTCPAGGTYTLNAVDTPPTCTIPAHALPK